MSISFQEYLFDPYAARGLFLLARELPTISSQITRNILIFIVLIIFLGYFAWIFELLKAKKPQLKDIIFFGFVSSWLTILGASVLAAGFAAMDPRRLFQTGLIILGIFAVMGGCRLFSFILRNKVEVNTNLVGAIFVTLMLFSGTGFIQEILDDTPSSIAISQQSIFEGNYPRSIMRFHMMTTPTQNIYSARWLEGHKHSERNVYRVDLVQTFPSLMIYNDIEKDRVNLALNAKLVEGNFEVMFIAPDAGEYIQLTYPNIHHELFWAFHGRLQKTIILEDTEEVLNHLYKASRIYDNGGSQIVLVN